MEDKLDALLSCCDFLLDTSSFRGLASIGVWCASMCESAVRLHSRLFSTCVLRLSFYYSIPIMRKESGLGFLLIVDEMKDMFRAGL